MPRKIDYDLLGQTIDSTWGRSSTPKSSSYSVKLTLQGPDRLLASYAAIVNFASEKQMIDMKRGYEEESRSVIDAIIKNVKERYKNIAEESITVKEVTSTDSVEIISFNVHNPKRTAYYRRKTIFEIG